MPHLKASKNPIRRTISSKILTIKSKKMKNLKYLFLLMLMVSMVACTEEDATPDVEDNETNGGGTLNYFGAEFTYVFADGSEEAVKMEANDGTLFSSSSIKISADLDDAGRESSLMNLELMGLINPSYLLDDDFFPSQDTQSDFTSDEKYGGFSSGSVIIYPSGSFDSADQSVLDFGGSESGRVTVTSVVLGSVDYSGTVIEGQIVEVSGTFEFTDERGAEGTTAIKNGKFRIQHPERSE